MENVNLNRNNFRPVAKDSAPNSLSASMEMGMKSDEGAANVANPFAGLPCAPVNEPLALRIEAAKSILVFA